MQQIRYVIRPGPYIFCICILLFLLTSLSAQQNSQVFVMLMVVLMTGLKLAPATTSALRVIMGSKESSLPLPQTCSSE